MLYYISFRLGPECCIPFPDISTVTIEKDQYARFIISSDSLWAVLSMEYAYKLVKKVKSPLHAAKMLARVAFRRRVAYGYRISDITVFVIDVNPECSRMKGSVTEALDSFISKLRSTFSRKNKTFEDQIR